MTEKEKVKKAEVSDGSRRRDGLDRLSVRFLIIIGMGMFFLSLGPSTLHGAGSHIYTYTEAHFSVAVPDGFQKMSQRRLHSDPLGPKRLKWCKDAQKQYNAIFIRSDFSDQPDDSLIVLGIKTYSHERKRFKIFREALSTVEFFDSGSIQKFRNLIKERLIKNGAKDVVVGDPILNKAKNHLSFFCGYGLSEKNEVREFHKVFLGRTHLVYADMIFYNISGAEAYDGMFQNITDSLAFHEGFEAKNSTMDAGINRVLSYELFGSTLSGLGRLVVHIIVIIFILNQMYDYLVNGQKRFHMKIEFLQKNSKTARLAMIPVGVLVYLMFI